MPIELVKYYTSSIVQMRQVQIVGAKDAECVTQIVRHGVLRVHHRYAPTLEMLPIGAMDVKELQWRRRLVQRALPGH
jgi:hypothetical protein